MQRVVARVPRRACWKQCRRDCASHPYKDLETSSKGGISLGMGSHQEGQECSWGQTIEEEEAKSDA